MFDFHLVWRERKCYREWEIFRGEVLGGICEKISGDEGNLDVGCVCRDTGMARMLNVQVREARWGRAVLGR